MEKLDSALCQWIVLYNNYFNFQFPYVHTLYKLNHFYIQSPILGLKSVRLLDAALPIENLKIRNTLIFWDCFQLVFSENFAIFLSTPFYVYEQLLLIFQEVLYFRLVQNRRKFYLFKGLFIWGETSLLSEMSHLNIIFIPRLY